MASASMGIQTDFSFSIRAATPAEIPALETLIAASARALSRGHYDENEIEAAVAHVFGVDSDLVADGTYLVAVDTDGAIIGCGGWSRRRTLFGGDQAGGRDSGRLNPAADAARIRAFFTAPGHERRGVASGLLAACEEEARQAGFLRAALMATLPGLPFYAAHGYVADEAIDHPCGDTTVPFVPMEKVLLRKCYIHPI
jgi:GNAT superfamily N-acetyltransferase